MAPEQLIDDLWGEMRPATAANTLQVYVSQVRKIVSDRLKTEAGSYRLRVEADELDADRFERLAVEGATALGRKSYGEASELLAEALADCGAARRSPTCVTTPSPRARSHGSRSCASPRSRIGSRPSSGSAGTTSSIGELEALVAEHPTRERLRGLLMLALYRAGRQADALEAYREAREVLLDELGLEPGPELRELEQAILRQDEALSRRPLPQSNVPVPVSTLVGRQRELEEITSALRDGSRVLTLTGPGGSGKTRLAIEAANILAGELPDGAFFVALDSIRDPALLLPAIAQAVAVRESSERPLPESLAERLAGRRALLRDRQLRAARGGRAPPLAGPRGRAGADLPRHEPSSAPGLRRAGVPRRPARPRGRRRAVRRACSGRRSSLPADRRERRCAVQEICARLDGLPLAVELAAARTKLLPPQAMLALLDERLDLLSRGARDLPERHRGLRDTVAWSYDLLGTEEKELFGRLAVFGGGFTLESAVGVCDASLDGVATLIDDSLLERDGERLRMLETIREYALEQLEADEDAEFVKATSCRALPQGRRVGARLGPGRLARPHGCRAGQLPRRARLGPRLGEASLGLRLAVVAVGVLVGPRPPRRGAWLARRGARQGRRGAAPELRARALHAAGSLATRQGDYESAAVLFEESLALWEELGDAAGTARSLLSMGTVAAEQGDQERAIELSERAAELYGESEDKRGHALAISNLGGIALERGRVREGRQAERAGVRAVRDARGQRGHGVRAGQPGLRGPLEGQLDRAVQLLREALRRLAELEFRDVIGYCFEGLAAVLALTGRAEEASKLLGAAEALRASLGVGLAPAEQATHDKTVRAVRETLGEKRFSAEWRQGRGAGSGRSHRVRARGGRGASGVSSRRRFLSETKITVNSA